MSGIWRNNPETREGKYLVKRRDGTIPHWPWFVLGGLDPASPGALLAYAAEAERLGMDPIYVADVRALIGTFRDWQADMPPEDLGDPDAPRHRKDDPATVAEMVKGRGA